MVSLHLHVFTQPRPKADIRRPAPVLRFNLARDGQAIGAAFLCKRFAFNLSSSARHMTPTFGVEAWKDVLCLCSAQAANLNDKRLPIGQVGYPARRRIAAQSMSTSQVSTPSNKISTIGRTSTPHIRSSRATWNSRLSTELASGSSDCGSREGVKPSANTVQTRSEKPCRIGPRGRKLQGWVLSLRPFGFLLLPAAKKRNTRSPRHLAACLRAICG